MLPYILNSSLLVLSLGRESRRRSCLCSVRPLTQTVLVYTQQLTLRELTWASDKWVTALSFYWELLLNRSVYQVLRGTDCICVYQSLQDWNTCSRCPLFRKSLMAEQLFSSESNSERWGGEVWIKQRGNRWRGGRRRKARFQKTCITVIRMEVFIVLTLVSLYIAAPTLRDIEQTLKCLWAEYLMIRGSKTTAKLDLPSPLLPAPSAHRHCCFSLSSSGSQPQDRQELNGKKDSSPKPLLSGMQPYTQIKTAQNIN